MSKSRSPSLRMAAAVEDCSLQLDILGHSMYVKARRQQGDAAEKEKLRLTLLRGECQRLSQLMSALDLELEEKQTFTCLQLFMEEEMKREREREQQEEVEQEVEREVERRGAALKLHEAELECRREELKEKDQLCITLQAQLHCMRENLEKKKEAEKTEAEWKLQATEAMNRRAEAQLKDELQRLETRVKDEKRSHEFVMKFHLDEHKVLQQNKEEFQQKKQKMLQEKKQQLSDICHKRKLNIDRLTMMSRKYKEMVQVMLEDREEQIQARAATKVQAWWRGCMVRRGLGPFKKERGDKKGKKAAKKKKKK
ncbi:dynein regulatory complex protein 9-like [Embiotoca jacksoni]|uniref:dynein regulatory complex protein 9-like n=1 Tax=Embiotoca jacksoni TaxID=100190 RepID=UPI003704A300